MDVYTTALDRQYKITHLPSIISKVNLEGIRELSDASVEVNLCTLSEHVGKLVEEITVATK